MPSRIARIFRRKEASSESNSIGAILLSFGFITREQLLAAITTKLRSSTEALLGEILVAQGAVTRWQLDRALTEQQTRRGNTIDYAAQMKTLIASVHVGSETVQARLDELRDLALDIAKNPPKLLPLRGAKSKF